MITPFLRIGVDPYLIVAVYLKAVPDCHERKIVIRHVMRKLLFFEKAYRLKNATRNEKAARRKERNFVQAVLLMFWQYIQQKL